MEHQPPVVELPGFRSHPVLAVKTATWWPPERPAHEGADETTARDSDEGCARAIAGQAADEMGQCVPHPRRESSRRAGRSPSWAALVAPGLDRVLPGVGQLVPVLELGLFEALLHGDGNLEAGGDDFGRLPRPDQRAGEQQIRTVAGREPTCNRMRLAPAKFGEAAIDADLLPVRLWSDSAWRTNTKWMIEDDAPAAGARRSRSLPRRRQGSLVALSGLLGGHQLNRVA